MNNNTDAQTVARFEVVGDKQKYTAARTLLYGNRLDTKIMCFVKIRIVRHRKKNSITLKLLYVRKKSEFGANDTAAVVLNAREPIWCYLFPKQRYCIITTITIPRQRLAIKIRLLYEN